MRNIKPAPKLVRLPYNGVTKNSASKPLTIWFNHTRLFQSRPGHPVQFQIRLATNEGREDSVIVEQYDATIGQVIEIIRVPISFIGLFQVSR
jgi:hypothetical protein